ncbi:MAG: DUF763 domain-containing protein [Deltaproteobacteria bacterium]|nr:DUF763 domain-containing protein [Deltaproteobacteria bacterium]
MKTGIAELPLHGGKTPKWLFSRMVRLARGISKAIIYNQGSEELLLRLSDPNWFQALGCVLGFDWHSSGITTTVCGAIKEAFKKEGTDWGFFVGGGKGASSRKTPDDIIEKGEFLKVEPEKLIYASRMAAKVDSAAMQDGYQLYHHSFFFTTTGKWAVVQQGMNEITKYARRYHWISDEVEEFVNEPHHAICCDQKGNIFNLVAKESKDARNYILDFTKQEPRITHKEIDKIVHLNMPAHHPVVLTPKGIKYLKNILTKIYETSPNSFEELLGKQGVGAKTLRALGLVSDIIYNSKVSQKDPVTYSFAHGGKDGHPYPVDKKTYDTTISYLENAISKAKIGYTDKMESLKRLNKWFNR